MLPITALACGIATNVAAAPLPVPLVDAPLAQSASVPVTLTIAGGCFWGIQAVFQHTKGVLKAISGYAGGEANTAHYDIVSSGMTGHAEAVQITYDPAQITPGQLLKVFFAVAHDPTELNRQGPDHGTQYRSAIFFSNDEQKKIAESYIDQLNKAAIYPKPIATKLEPLKAFYAAEDYHQDYARLHPDNGYIVVNDLPKVEALKNNLPDLFVNK